MEELVSEVDRDRQTCAALPLSHHETCLPCSEGHEISGALKRWPSFSSLRFADLALVWRHAHTQLFKLISHIDYSKSLCPSNMRMKVYEIMHIEISESDKQLKSTPYITLLYIFNEHFECCCLDYFGTAFCHLWNKWLRLNPSVCYVFLYNIMFFLFLIIII